MFEADNDRFRALQTADRTLQITSGLDYSPRNNALSITIPFSGRSRKNSADTAFPAPRFLKYSFHVLQPGFLDKIAGNNLTA
jgi:hypothetical protein